jgi:D-xylose reductase
MESPCRQGCRHCLPRKQQIPDTVPVSQLSILICQAIKTGYRLFDGAYDYQNEKEAGEGVRRAISDGLVKREDIFITTKLWNNYHQRDHALAMAKAQNEAWGLGYIDLYLIHFPIALKYIEPEKLQYPVSGIPPSTIPQSNTD